MPLPAAVSQPPQTTTPLLRAALPDRQQQAQPTTSDHRQGGRPRQRNQKPQNGIPSAKEQNSLLKKPHAVVAMSFFSSRPLTANSLCIYETVHTESLNKSSGPLGVETVQRTIAQSAPRVGRGIEETGRPTPSHTRMAGGGVEPCILREQRGSCGSPGGVWRSVSRRGQPI